MSQPAFDQRPRRGRTVAIDAQLGAGVARDQRRFVASLGRDRCRGSTHSACAASSRP